MMISNGGLLFWDTLYSLL